MIWKIFKCNGALIKGQFRKSYNVTDIQNIAVFNLNWMLCTSNDANRIANSANLDHIPG